MRSASRNCRASASHRGGRRSGQPDRSADHRRPASRRRAHVRPRHVGRPRAAPYPIDYQWVRDNQDLTGETGPTHTIVTAADVGRGLRCDVRATGDYGSTEASSPTFYPPAPTPSRRRGQRRPAARPHADLHPRHVERRRRPRLPDRHHVAAQRRRDRRPDRLRPTRSRAADVGHQIAVPRERRSARELDRHRRLPDRAGDPRRSPAVSGDLRLGGKLSCGRGTWDDEGLDALRHDQAVAARQRRDPRRHRRRLHRPARRHRPPTQLPRPRRGPDRLDLAEPSIRPARRQRSQPGIEGDPRLGRTLTCTRGTWDDAGRTADYAVSYEWYRNSVFVSRRAPTTPSPPSTSTSRCAARSPSRGSTPVHSADDLRRGAAQPDLPTLVRRRPPRPHLSCIRGVWDDPATAVRRHLPVAAQRRADRRRDARHLRDHAPPTSTAASRAASPPPASPTRPRRSVSVQPPRGLPAPRIEGDPRVGSTLTCTRGDWDDPATPVRRHLPVVPRRHGDRRRHQRRPTR